MEFLSYFKAVQRAPRPKSQPIALFVAGYVILFSSIYLGGVAGWFPFLASLAFSAGLSICYWCNSAPNLEKVFPVNHRKKLLYRFLSSLLMFLILTAIVTASFLVVFLFSLIVASIAVGGLVWVVDVEFYDGLGAAFGAIFGSMGVYGGLFGLAYFIILYSAGMITGFIKKRKIRNIFLVCLCAGIFLSWVVMCIPYFVSTSSFSGASPFNKACYEAMGAPWISTVFWLLVAAGALGTAIYLGIKHYDPKKF